MHTELQSPIPPLPPKPNPTPPTPTPTHPQHTHPVGNPHNLGAKPKTFTRQVISLCASPWLLDDPRAAGLFPDDVVGRARRLVGAFAGGVGSYRWVIVRYEYVYVHLFSRNVYVYVFTLLFICVCVFAGDLRGL